jgi:glutathionylspermidine synthase
MTPSRQLLQRLEVQHDQAWRDIVTLHEWPFDLTRSHEFILLPQGAKLLEPQRHTIKSQKFMLPIIWHPRGFH